MTNPLILSATLAVISQVLLATESTSEQTPVVLATGNPGTWAYTEITDANIAGAVRALPSIVTRAMNKTGVPGIAVAVVRADEVLMARGFGVREVGKPQQIDADTVFQLASLSKAVGATVISRAVSKQWVSWADPVISYLPWFKIGDDYVTQNVTIADLYSHRSGLPDHGGDMLEDLGYNREQILQRLAKLPSGPFRVQYAYTNFGLTAAAEAVATAIGKSWEQLSADLLYQPAGMNSTSSTYSDYLAAPNRAITHQSEAGVWFPGPPRDPQPESPAGGVSASVNDMARWLRLQLGNGTLDGEELIKADVLQMMRQPQSTSNRSIIPDARTSFYGFGLGSGVDGVGHVTWSHSGAFLLGAATSMVLLPGGDVAIVVLTNGEPHGIPEAIAATFVDIVETGKERRDWLSAFAGLFNGFYFNPSVLADKEHPLNPQPAQPLVDYVGVYQNAYFGPAEISVVNGKLEMALGPAPLRFLLTHWDGDAFSYLPTGENAVGISAVTFDPDKQIVTVEHLDEFKLGTFAK